MFSQLPLHVRKALLGQMIVVEVLERNRGWLCANGHDGLWEHFASQAEYLSRLAVEIPEPNQDLHAYLSALVEKVFAAPATTTKSLCAQIRAEALAAISLPPEDGGYPLEIEGALAIEVARLFHETSAIAVPEPLLSGAEIVAGWRSEGLPHAYPTDHGLGGMTVCSSRTTQTRIELILAVGGLDWRSRMATFYVLLHELISHAFVGPWSSPRAQEKGDLWFAEGWMDTIAFQVHNEIFESSPRFDASIANRLGHHDDRLASARALYEARYVKADGDGRAFAGRKLGRDAANRVLDAFGRLPETEDDPLGSLWRLSAALNTSSLPQIARREIVQKLTWSPSYLSRRVPAVRALRQWAESAPAVAAPTNRQAWDAALAFATL